jgi:hypothetical protein
MRLPHLLEECSLHGGSLAASIALVDGSPAQRASTSQMLVCMLQPGVLSPRKECEETSPGRGGEQHRTR